MSSSLILRWVSLPLLSTLVACGALQQGAKMHEAGDIQSAIQAYQVYLQQNPNDADAHNNLGNAYLQSQNYTKAVEHLKQAVSLHDDPVYLHNLEIAYKWAFKRASDQALVQEAHAFQKSPNKVGFVLTLANAQPVEPHTKELVATQPKPETTLSQIQNVQKENKQLAQLEQNTKQTIASKPTEADLGKPIDYSKLQPGAVKWAVVIGVSDYSKGSDYEPLPYAAEDARKVYSYLTEKGGFAKDHVKLLIDKDASATNIRDAFGRFLRNNANSPDDIVFVYYSGHGDLVDRTDAYIVPHGVDRRDLLVSQGVPLHELDYNINRLDSKKVAMFIDSCHSGSVIQGVNSKGIFQNMTGISDNFLNIAGEGRLIMTSSQANEKSLELEGTGGLFTHYLLKGLNGEADMIDVNGKVTVEELFQYVRRNVLTESRNRTNTSQTPQKSGDLTGDLVQVKK